MRMEKARRMSERKKVRARATDRDIYPSVMMPRRGEFVMTMTRRRGEEEERSARVEGGRVESSEKMVYYILRV